MATRIGAPTRRWLAAVDQEPLVWPVLAWVVLMCGAGMPSLNGQTSDGEPIVIGRSYTLQSDVLEQVRRFNVYLPPGYEESESTSYPVLYLLDGGVAEDFVHIVGIAALAADFRRIRPFIVVGVEGIDRYHDLVHPTSVEEERERLPTAGGSEDFRQFLAKELRPAVTSRFRVSDETVLIGESAAGLFVVETLLRQPDLFGGYVAVSPMLWWDGGSLSKASAEMVGAIELRSPGRLFLTIADEGGDMREGVDRVVSALEDGAPRHLEWRFEPMEEESHGTIFHPAALAAVRWLFATAEVAP